MAPTGPEEARRRLEAAGQGHLVEHADGLGGAARDRFLLAASQEPWERIRDGLEHPAPPAPPVLRPPQALRLRRQRAQAGLRPRLAGLGRRLLAGGRVATVLLAGGQGSRLGFPGPKGCFVLGPGDDRTLYAIQAERVAQAARSSGGPPVPLYVLVSEATREATERAFAEGASGWGLAPGQVHIVEQGTLPAVDLGGRALLEAPGRLARAPDGHGGALGALAAAGVLERLAADGVDVLTTFQVDNPLALPLDPVMLGWMLERHAQVVTKAVERLPGEKVGLCVRDVEGRHRIVEYSELPEGGVGEELRLGSIALHAMSVRWLLDLVAAGLTLPLHVARKRVPHLGDPDPSGPNALKLELFLFDVFPHADRLEVQEVPREREFAPVKNAEGVDSPATARALVEAEVRRWYQARGRPVPEPPSLRPLEMVDLPA